MSGARNARSRRKTAALFLVGAAAEVQVLESRQLLTAGAIDTTFGTNGATAPAGASIFAMQANDECVTAGMVAGTKFKYHGTTYTPNNLLLTRYTTSGTLDTSFGGAGQVSISLGGNNTINSVVAEKFDASGRILVVAQDNTNVTGGGTTEIVVMRINSNGTLDSTFGNKGAFAETTATNGGSLATDPQGRIILFAAGSSQAQIFRLNPNGTADSTFGSSGVVSCSSSIPNGGQILLQSSTTDPNGYKIVYGGGAGPVSTVARFNSDGSIDVSFGTRGTTTFSVPVPADQLAAGYRPHNYCNLHGITLESDGSIVVAGTVGLYTPTNGLIGDGYVGHISANGIADNSFGNNGFAYAPYSTTGWAVSQVEAVRVDSNGNILAVGVFAPTTSASNVLLERFSSTGQVDTSFGSGQGYILGCANAYSTDVPNNLEIQSDGKIVILAGNGPYSLYRYLGG
jgi:uncharacterized delta-60 repeat protein